MLAVNVYDFVDFTSKKVMPNNTNSCVTASANAKDFQKANFGKYLLNQVSGVSQSNSINYCYVTLSPGSVLAAKLIRISTVHY